jgi:hypothetical protein
MNEEIKKEYNISLGGEDGFDTTRFLTEAEYDLLYNIFEEVSGNYTQIQIYERNSTN